jgi:transposase-like protein
MNKLSDKKRAQILSVLVEGNSLRATARICDVAFNTVLKFVPEIGKACAEYQSRESLPNYDILSSFSFLDSPVIRPPSGSEANET